MAYNFKSIQVVSSAHDLIDITLSRTQRRTPTQIRSGFAITRIRSFYMRKVKFTQQTLHDKLSAILDQFPDISNIHPFHSALMGVLYNKDHYKLALGQLSTARHLIDSLGKEYVRLLKFGDSLYRCKTLKRAALGRMMTIVKKQKASLAYLEQVRQHLSRLPQIDPNTRTLLITGYPNVGKSTFMNTMTRANVDVQPYAFTTKSLFVGHFDWQYIRWQVIDTPGILDHPLQEMNAIEMQSVTAMAHLRAGILFFVDISEECGYTIAEQVQLFENIKPLFSGKPLTVVLTKIDVKRPAELDVEDKKLLQGLVGDNVEMMALSSHAQEGLTEVKENICRRLLEQRVEAKLANAKKFSSIRSRLHIAMPKPRDNVERPPQIPEAVIAKRAGAMMDTDRILERDLEAAAGGHGQYDVDLRKKWILDNPEWRYDVIPEIVDGHNVADFIDPDIMGRLEALEREEEARLAAQESLSDSEEDDPFAAERKKAVAAIRAKKAILIQVNRLARKRDKNRPQVTRNRPFRVSISQFSEEMRELGVDPSVAKQRLRKISRSKSRERSRTVQRAVENSGPRDHRSRSQSRARDTSLANVEQASAAHRIKKRSDKARNRVGRIGEADRRINDSMPKHLFSGKRGAGKTDRR